MRPACREGTLSINDFHSPQNARRALFESFESVCRKMTRRLGCLRNKFPNLERSSPILRLTACSPITRQPLVPYTTVSVPGTAASQEENHFLIS
jgi:hypothetical protein